MNLKSIESEVMEIKSTFRKIAAATLHVSKPVDWLTSRFHFNFADYYDPQKRNFGVLRVLNDDLVLANSGFPTHPHRDQEIFSYIIDGELSHADSEGHHETIGPGSIQYMSAGKGVFHSEMNNHPTDTVRFLQIWISPNQRGLPVKYGSHRFNLEDRRNVFLPVIKGVGVSSQNNPAPITLSQDCNVYVSEIDKGVCVNMDIDSGRQAYMVLIDGDASIGENVETLTTRDGMEIYGPCNLKVSSNSLKSHFIVIEMKAA